MTGATPTFTPAATTMYIANCSTGGNSAISVQVAAITLSVNADILTESLSIKALRAVSSNKKIGQSGAITQAYVAFEAGNSIKLLPGFETINSSVFKAEIKQCPNL